VLCLGAEIPPGLSPYGWDVDDASPAVVSDAGLDDVLSTLLQ
jgi:hypothetical protein